MTCWARAAILLIVASGCGGSLASKSDASGNLPGDDAALVDVFIADTTGQADAVVVTDVGGAQDALACGAMTCGAGQLCVMEFCGGGPNPCMAPMDGGVCPDGWILQHGVSCPSAEGTSACYLPPCTNPPPHCEDRPAACADPLSCWCLTGVCKFASCASASGNLVYCAAV
jgi:hypothetical protein